MAENSQIIEKVINVNVNQANKSIQSLNENLEDTGQTFKSMKDYKKYIDQMTSSLLDLDETSEEYSQTLKKIQDAQEKYKKIVNDTKYGNNALEGSYDALVKKMSQLRKEWKATNDEAKRNELGTQINEINNQLKEWDYSIGNFQRNVGNYSSAFMGAFRDISEGLDVVVPGAKEGFKAIEDLFKGFSGIKSLFTNLKESFGDMFGKTTEVIVNTKDTTKDAVKEINDIAKEGAVTSNEIYSSQQKNIKTEIKLLKDLQKIEKQLFDDRVLNRLEMSNTKQDINKYKDNLKNLTNADDINEALNKISKLESRYSELSKAEKDYIEVLIKTREKIKEQDYVIKKLQEEQSTLNRITRTFSTIWKSTLLSLGIGAAIAGITIAVGFLIDKIKDLNGVTERSKKIIEDWKTELSETQSVIEDYLSINTRLMTAQGKSQEEIFNVSREAWKANVDELQKQFNIYKSIMDEYNTYENKAAIGAKKIRDKVFSQYGLVSMEDFQAMMDNTLEALNKAKEKINKIDQDSLVEKKKKEKEESDRLAQVAKSQYEKRIKVAYESAKKEADIWMEAFNEEIESLPEPRLIEVKKDIFDTKAESKSFNQALSIKSNLNRNSSIESQRDYDLSALKIKYEEELALLEKYGMDSTSLTKKYEEEKAKIIDEANKKIIESKKKTDEELKKESWGNATLDMANNIVNALNSISNAWENSLDMQLKTGKLSEKEYEQRKKVMQAFQISMIIAQAAVASWESWRAYISETATINPQTAAVAGPGAAGVLAALNSASLVKAITNQGITIASAVAQIAAIKSNTIGNSSTSTNANTQTASYSPSYTENITGKSDADYLSNSLSNSVNSQRVYILESDIQNSNKRVEVRDKETTF